MIRFAKSEDAAPMLAIYAPVVTETQISFELEPPSVEEMRARVDKTLAKYPWLVFERDGWIAGYAYASEHRSRAAYQWSADVSCYVHPDARRQGVGSALYHALLRILRKQGYHAAFAGITLPNPASVRLHEAVGFEAVGGVYREVGFKLGAWHDTGWWQCILGAPPAEPEAPRPLPQLGLGVLDEL
jgi:L-amino acid N-acyltransferase YncA